MFAHSELFNAAGFSACNFMAVSQAPEPRLAESRNKQICIALLYVSTWAVCCPVDVQLEETQIFLKNKYNLFRYKTIYLIQFILCKRLVLMLYTIPGNGDINSHHFFYGIALQIYWGCGDSIVQQLR